MFTSLSRSCIMIPRLLMIQHNFYLKSKKKKKKCRVKVNGDKILGNTPEPDPVLNPITFEPDSSAEEQRGRQ